MPVQAVYLFGPFRLDATGRRLERDAEPVALSDRQLDVLALLLSQSPQVVSKEMLIEAAWKDVAVGDNSLEQVISSLRRLLGSAPDGAPFIETLARRGYRFRAPVQRLVGRHSDEALDAMLAPYRSFVEGRAALETLEHGAVIRARGVFSDIVRAAPDYAPGHIGLANALALAFDATRAGASPDVPALLAAVHHGREACRLDPSSGEGWASLGLALSRMGASSEAAAACRRAIALEPDNWRHHARAAYGTWGEERLRAARRAAQLMPGLALAHWLAASVHVARGAMQEAERELDAGTSAQDEQGTASRFSAVGLHLLLGLVRLARGDAAAAESEFARELSFKDAGHIHTAQACANTWCAIGALDLRRARISEAAAAFDHALELVPGHVLALAALAEVASPDRRRAAATQLGDRLEFLQSHGATVEAAMAASVGPALAGRHAEAAAVLESALQAAPSGSSTGWTLPVEPLLDVAAHPDEWSGVLNSLRTRAA